MAGSVNKVILVGNLGADPEIRRTQDGRPIANLRVATSDSWRDKATGERQGKDRVAPRRHLQRESVPDRRAISQKGLEGLHRRPAADAQMAGPVRPGPLLDRGGAAGLPRRTDAARPRRCAAAPAAAAAAISAPMKRAASSARPDRRARSPPQAPAPAPTAARAATWTTKFRFEFRVRGCLEEFLAAVHSLPRAHGEREPEAISSMPSERRHRRRSLGIAITDSPRPRGACHRSAEAGPVGAPPE